MVARKRASVVGAVLVMALVAGCGVSAPVPPSGAATNVPVRSTVSTIAPEPVIPLTPDQAALAYGLGPVRDPSVTYQPDVVLVEGGPSIIHWASDDALTWAIDRNAPGAADLALGKVMFATSVAIGRVAAIDDQGGERIVTIAPIGLTELVREADLEIDQDVDLAAASYHRLPADIPAQLPDEAPAASPSPAGDADPSDGSAVVTLPTLRLVAYRAEATARMASANDRLTFPAKVCPEFGVGNWSAETCVDSTGITLTVDHKVSGHLKLGGVLKLPTAKLRFRGGTVVRDGQVVSSGGVLEGIRGIEISLSGGVGNGAQDNAKIKFEVPLEIETASIVVAGIPMKMLIEAKFTLETAFSGRNSTLSATGRYALDGPIGIVDGKPVAPTVSVRSSILDSLGGITVGPSGMVFGAKFKLQGGIGVYGFVVGPYATITISIGIGQGSVIGASLAECRGATLGIWVGGGAGYSINPSKMAWLFGKNSAISRYTAKLEEDLLQFQVFNRTVVKPDVPLCRG